ncbi:hypothetical protein KJ966_03875 [bacterium]|nr:hypothetical protein [bacterium]
MRIRIAKFLIPVLAVFLVASCGKINVEALKSTKNVALISFMAEESIDTSAVTQGSIQGLVANAVQGDATDMKPKMVSAKNRILKQAPSILGFKMIDENQVIKKKSYQAIDDSNANMFGNFVTPKGYKVIAGNQTENILQAIKEVKGADGAMLITLKCRLVKGIDTIAGGTAILWGDMTFYLYNKSGEIILQKTASEPSDTTTTQAHGVFAGGNLQKMVDEVIDKDLKAINAYIKEETMKVQG